MEAAEALLLARTQFGLNIAFHILFPTLTIGLAWFLVYFRLRYHRSGDAAWSSVDVFDTAAPRLLGFETGSRFTF